MAIRIATNSPGSRLTPGRSGTGFRLLLGLRWQRACEAKAGGIFVLTGDGELQEGSNWEAAMTAQHYGLDNLVVIVDRNRIQQGDFTEKIIRMDPLAAKWAAFGFAVAEIDGHDHAALLERFSNLPIEQGKPTCIIANTIKGKGVSFAENKPAWHHGVPTKEQLAVAAAELGVEGNQ